MSSGSPVSRSGRFSSLPDEAVTRFAESVSADWRLWQQDIMGSIAHASMLHEVGLLTEEEKDAITDGLEVIGQEIADDRFEWRTDLEDVHMNIEAELTRRVPAGAKLHAGRSRNDQIALDMRLWARDEIVELNQEIQALQLSLVDLGKANSRTIIPGYTHLQRAQPVHFAHHLLAYVEMLARDRDRFRDCLHRINVCPLGSGALNGSSLPLNRNAVAEFLGFTDADGTARLTQNSMDAVSDRDFVVEFCSTASIVAIHLSRLAEDIIFWASSEAGFITIGDAYTTGSSLMPHKKNPDLAELTRGKSGRVIGNLTGLLSLLKGLPMTYNRDLQEDKRHLFDTADTIRSTVSVMGAMLEHTTVNEEACRKAAADPSLLATDLADYLVLKGIPFRNAHHLVGEVVAYAEKHGKALNALTVEELQAIDSTFEADALSVFDIESALNRRQVVGASSQTEVDRQLRAWKDQLTE